MGVDSTTVAEFILHCILTRDAEADASMRSFPTTMGSMSARKLFWPGFGDQEPLFLSHRQVYSGQWQVIRRNCYEIHR